MDLVSVLAKSVGCSDSEKQDVKKDERRLMTVERRAMARCQIGKVVSIELGLLTHLPYCS